MSSATRRPRWGSSAGKSTSPEGVCAPTAGSLCRRASAKTAPSSASSTEAASPTPSSSHPMSKRDRRADK